MMGKGQRGGQEDVIKAFEGPLWGANTLLARNAGNIMYGGDTSSPANYNQPSPVGGTAVPRQRAPGITAGPVPTRGGGQGDIGTLPRGGGTVQSGGERGPPVRGQGMSIGEMNKYRAEFERVFPGDYVSSEELGAKEGELSKLGMTVIRNSAGDADMIQLPDGSFIVVASGSDPAGGPRAWDLAARYSGPDGKYGTPEGAYGPGGQGVSGPGDGGVAGMSINNYLDLMNRYGEFAETGGYDPQTLDAIRSRALSPSRAVYSDVNRSIDRSRSLQGDYAPNYAAVKAKAARGQSMALSDATTNVEGGIGQMVQRGKLAGLGGMSSLYGTTPGLANMFGNQALQAQQLQNQAGFGLIAARQRAQGLPGAFEQTMGRVGSIGGMALPFLSDRDSKKNIKPIKKGILYKLKRLPISTWSYKDDPDGTIHIGPMAQDFYELFGGDDDKTIHPVDVAGVTLGAVKELAEVYGT